MIKYPPIEEDKILEAVLSFIFKVTFGAMTFLQNTKFIFSSNWIFP